MELLCTVAVVQGTRALKTLVYTYSLSTVCSSPVMTVITYLHVRVATRHCLSFACLDRDCLPAYFRPGFRPLKFS